MFSKSFQHFIVDIPRFIHQPNFYPKWSLWTLNLIPKKNKSLSTLKLLYPPCWIPYSLWFWHVVLLLVHKNWKVSSHSNVKWFFGEFTDLGLHLEIFWTGTHPLNLYWELNFLLNQLRYDFHHKPFLMLLNGLRNQQQYSCHVFTTTCISLVND